MHHLLVLGPIQWGQRHSSEFLRRSVFEMKMGSVGDLDVLAMEVNYLKNFFVEIFSGLFL